MDSESSFIPIRINQPCPDLDFDVMVEGPKVILQGSVGMKSTLDAIPEETAPLEALARLYYVDPYYRFYGEIKEYLDMIVHDATESRPDAAINWFNAKCRMGGAAAKVVKDSLWEKLKIPTLTMDVDMLDASKSLEARLKDLIEKFLDIL